MSEIIAKPMSEQLTMKKYESISDSDLVQYKEYIISNYPNDGANNEQMEYALTCKRLFSEGTVITYIGDSNEKYTKGHIYQIKIVDSAKTWEDITDAPIKILVSSMDNPIDVFTAMSKAGLYLLIPENGLCSILKKNAKGGIIKVVSGVALIISEGKIPDHSHIVIMGVNLGWSRNDQHIASYTGLSFSMHFGPNGWTGWVETSSGVGNINGRMGFNLRSFYAPEESGTLGQILQSNGENNIPTWITPNYATQQDIENAIGNVSELLGNTDDLENVLEPDMWEG